MVLPLQLTSCWSCWDWDWTFHFQLCSAPWGAAHSIDFGVWIKFFNILIFEESFSSNILPIITKGIIHENNSSIKSNQVKEKCSFRVSLKFLCTNKLCYPKPYALIWYSFMVVLITQSLHKLLFCKQLVYIFKVTLLCSVQIKLKMLYCICKPISCMFCFLPLI